MTNPYISGTTRFHVDETPNSGGRVWNFAMGCGEETTFSATYSSAEWTVSWDDMRARILEGDPATVATELAHWLRGMTGGAMPYNVADRAAPLIADWLNSNAHYLQHEREQG